MADLTSMPTTCKAANASDFTDEITVEIDYSAPTEVKWNDDKECYLFPCNTDESW